MFVEPIFVQFELVSVMLDYRFVDGPLLGEIGLKTVESRLFGMLVIGKIFAKS